MRVNCDTAQEYYIQQTIKDKLQGYNYAYPKSTASILLSLSIDLQQLRDQLQSTSTVGQLVPSAADNNNNNGYLERLTRTCPKRLYIL